MTVRVPTYGSRIGRVIRLPLRLVPADLPLPMLQRSLRGFRWLPGAGVHGYWIGTYEVQKRRRFEREVRPGETIFDIGANVGYYSLLASRLVDEAGQVVAFEPSPRNAGYIRRHVEMNALSNVEVMQVAVTAGTGYAAFDESSNTSSGHVSQGGTITVECVTLDACLERGMVPAPDVMKIDVEGAELQVLEGAKSTLTQHRPRIFLATHSPHLTSLCLAYLAELGYRWEALCDSPRKECDEFYLRR